MKSKNVFIENLQMETQTVFNQNGNINIYPCGFEMGQHIVSEKIAAVAITRSSAQLTAR